VATGGVVLVGGAGRVVEGVVLLGGVMLVAGGGAGRVFAGAGVGGVTGAGGGEGLVFASGVAAAGGAGGVTGLGAVVSVGGVLVGLGDGGALTVGLGAGGGVEGESTLGLVMFPSPVGGLGGSNTPLSDPPVNLLERSVDGFAPGAPAAIGGAATGGVTGALTGGAVVGDGLGLVEGGAVVVLGALVAGVPGVPGVPEAGLPTVGPLGVPVTGVLTLGAPMVGLGAGGGVEGDVTGALVMLPSPVGGLGASKTPLPGPPVNLLERSDPPVAPGAAPGAIGAPAIGGGVTVGAPDSAPPMLRAAVLAPEAVAPVTGPAPGVGPPLTAGPPDGVAPAAPPPREPP
jgi:elastin